MRSAQKPVHHTRAGLGLHPWSMASPDYWDPSGPAPSAIVSSGWRGRYLVSTLRGVALLLSWGCHRDHVADAMIEAHYSSPKARGCCTTYNS